MVRELQVAGYTGDFDVELFGQDIELCDYGQLLEEYAATVRAYGLLGVSWLIPSS